MASSNSMNSETTYLSSLAWPPQSIWDDSTIIKKGLPAAFILSKLSLVISFRAGFLPNINEGGSDSCVKKPIFWAELFLNSLILFTNW